SASSQRFLGPTGLSPEFHVKCGNGPIAPQPAEVGGNWHSRRRFTMCQCVPSEERNAMAPPVGNRAMLPLHGVQAAISLLTPPPETIAEPVIGAEQQHAMDLRGAVDELGSPGIAVD